MKFSKKDFAAMTGQTTKTLAVYASVKQKKVIYTDDGGVDTDNPINALFLAKHGHKGNKATNQKAAEIVNRAVEDNDFQDLDDKKPRKPKEQAKTELIELAEELERLKVDLAKRKIKQADIDIEKKIGEVMPIELVKEVVSMNAKSIVIAIRDAWSKEIDLFVLKYGINSEDAAKLRKGREVALNQASEKANIFTKSQLKGIVSEYSVKRGVGERGQ